MSNKINPSYYKNKRVETIDAIESQISPSEFEGYLKGNVFKYVSRSGQKPGNSKLEDYLKAEWYLKRLIKDAEEEEGDQPSRTKPIDFSDILDRPTNG